MLGHAKHTGMGTIHVSAERRVEGAPETVYGYIADMQEHHQHLLPPAFSDFQIESGGVGAARSPASK